MNTNELAYRQRFDGNSVIERIWMISAITIAIPLSTIFFGANETDPDRSLDGILVREPGRKEKGISVNLSILPPRFDFRELNENGSAGETPVPSSEVWGEELPPVQNSELSPVSLSFEALDQSPVLAQIKEVNPMALALPAARGRFSINEEGSITDSKGSVMAAIVPVRGVEKSKAKKISFVPSLEEGESSRFESARDFVASLGHDADGGKIRKTSTGREGD